MKILPNDLPNDVESLKALLLEQAILLDKKDSELTQWQSKYQLILEQWRLAQQKQFGKGSEVSPGQSELFDESVNDSQEDRSDVDTVIAKLFSIRAQNLSASLCRKTYLVKQLWWM
tara:strand:- start:22290 stop:22637 length:348 start_codon:yes stop_codon:yes gene_type:complete